METVLASVLSATVGAPVEGSYPQQLGQAVAAAAVLAGMLVVIFLVCRAAFRILRTRLLPETAFLVTLVSFSVVVLIGWLNR